jgi:hypothetical protein
MSTASSVEVSEADKLLHREVEKQLKEVSSSPSFYSRMIPPWSPDLC